MEKLREQYEQEIIPAMMKKFNYKSVMQVPKLDKTKLLIIDPIDPPREKLDMAIKTAIKIAMILPTTLNVVAFSF